MMPNRAVHPVVLPFPAIERRNHAIDKEQVPGVLEDRVLDVMHGLDGIL